MKTLYQFSFSHYCEKARWALDHKGQSYIIKNLLPGPHRATTTKLAPASHVPILVDDGTVIQGSNAIIDHLDQMHPEDSLTPEDSLLADEARAWEAYLDEEIGVAIRCWFYHHTLPDRKAALTFILKDAPWYGPALYAVIFPKVREAMVELMNINDDSARESQERVLSALTRINDVLREQRFLVGDQFTRADLTACALLSLLCLPNPELQTVLPEPVKAFAIRVADQPVYNWVSETYRNHRGILKAAA